VGAALAGPAATASVPAGDNLAIQSAVAEADPGSVVVVEVVGEAPGAYWGEVLTVAAQSRGIAGVVLEGPVRDVEATRRRGFPCFGTGTDPRGPTKAGGGSIGGPVRVGGVRVNPGDWVVGDDDGVVVLPGADLERIIAAATAKADREPELIAAIEAGATTLEVLDLDDSSVQRH
jgi:regulator of RNase E activity RraA